MNKKKKKNQRRILQIYTNTHTANMVLAVGHLIFIQIELPTSSAAPNVEKKKLIQITVYYCRKNNKNIKKKKKCEEEERKNTTQNCFSLKCYIAEHDEIVVHGHDSI